MRFHPFGQKPAGGKRPVADIGRIVQILPMPVWHSGVWLASNRKLLAIYLVFWAVFTASYGALRLVKHDQWRWDSLVEAYIGMSVAFFIIWGIERTKQDAD